MATYDNYGLTYDEGLLSYDGAVADSQNIKQKGIGKSSRASLSYRHFKGQENELSLCVMIDLTDINGCVVDTSISSKNFTFTGSPPNIEIKEIKVKNSKQFLVGIDATKTKAAGK